MPVHRYTHGGDDNTDSECSDSEYELDLEVAVEVKALLSSSEENATTVVDVQSLNATTATRPPPPTARVRTMPTSLGKGRACLKCRSRKMRCDGKRPQCASCFKANRECIYEEERSRTKKLLDKIEVLEAKLADLQESAQRRRTRHRRPTIATNAAAASATTSPVSAATTAVAASSSSPGKPAPFDVEDLERLERCKRDVLVMPLDGVSTSDVDFTGEWWLGDHPPRPIRDFLITTCLSQRVRPGLLIDTDRFLESIYMPSAENPPPQASLLNAMYLIGCHLPNDPHLSTVESVYVARTRKHLLDELSRPDTRITQWIQASCLLSFYLQRVGRFMEARHEISGTVPLVVACGLHKITSSAWPPPGESDEEPEIVGSLRAPITVEKMTLPPPRDATELRERIGLFWMAYQLDQYISILCGLQANKWIDGEIETVWPRPLGKDPGSELHPPDGSITDLLGPSPKPPFDPHCSMSALRIKAMVMLARVTGFATSLTPEIGRIAGYRKFQEYHHAVFVFHGGLPPLSYDPRTTEVRIVPEPSINVSLFLIHTMTIVALVHLYGTLNFVTGPGPQREVMYQRRLTMCRRGVALVQAALSAGVPVTALPASCGFYWCAISRVLVDHLHKLRERNLTAGRVGPTAEGESYYQDLTTLLDATGKMSPAFPMLDYQLRRIKDDMGDVAETA